MQIRVKQILVLFGLLISASTTLLSFKFAAAPPAWVSSLIRQRLAFLAPIYLWTSKNFAPDRNPRLDRPAPCLLARPSLFVSHALDSQHSRNVIERCTTRTAWPTRRGTPWCGCPPARPGCLTSAGCISWGQCRLLLHASHVAAASSGLAEALLANSRKKSSWWPDWPWPTRTNSVIGAGRGSHRGGSLYFTAKLQLSYYV